jgi:hypothetical protein
MAGLRSYAQYGAQNPFNNVLTDAELDAVKAEDLVALNDCSTTSMKFFIMDQSWSRSCSNIETSS